MDLFLILSLTGVSLIIKFQQPQPIPPTPQPPPVSHQPLSDGNPPLRVSTFSELGLHPNNVVNGGTNGHGPTGTQTTASCSAQVNGSVESAIPRLNHAIEASSVRIPAQNETRKLDSDQPVNLEEVNKFSPKPNKRKTSINKSADGSKRCKCTKITCLKLYCECFVSGFFCSESCACQECFNTNMYEDTVLMTRSQIQSRDSLAFAPKVVQIPKESPLNDGEDARNLVPALARHKKGCNCLQSMCVRRYCQCFQAKVGCTSACHCVNCQNCHGRREEQYENPQIASGGADVSQDVSHPECNGQPGLAPETPTFQHSNHGKNPPESWAAAPRSPPHAKPNLLDTSDKIDMLSDSRNGNLQGIHPFTPSTSIGETWKSVNQPSKGSGFNDTTESEPINEKIITPSPHDDKNEVGLDSSDRRYVLKTGTPPLLPENPHMNKSGSSSDEGGNDIPDTNDNDTK